MITKKIISIFITLLLLSACSGGNGVIKDGKFAPQQLKTDDPKVAVEEAGKIIQKAAEMGHEWTTTGKHLKKAKQALAVGENDQALKYAKKAYFEAQASIHQAITSKNNWQKSVLQ